MRKAIVVNANKSWYEGYIPLYIYFANRACPDADIIVHLMGKASQVIFNALEELGVDRRAYRIIENYKLGYGQSVIASKLARWTVSHALIREYDLVYVGDIDMFLAHEGANDLFSQHLKHSEKLGVPISNKVRKGSERLTGLHFFVCKPYFEEMEGQIEELDSQILAFNGDDKGLTGHFPKSDELILYKMVDQVRPDWIDALKSSSFRPYHGAHMGNFRDPNSKAYRYLSDCISSNRLSDNQTFYQSDIFSHMEEARILDACQELFSSFPKVGDACMRFYHFVDAHRSSVCFKGVL